MLLNNTNTFHANMFRTETVISATDVALNEQENNSVRE